jgi:hypothetical protein
VLETNAGSCRSLLKETAHSLETLETTRCLFRLGPRSSLSQHRASLPALIRLGFTIVTWRLYAGWYRAGGVRHTT